MCCNDFKIFPGHGTIGVSSVVVNKAIEALAPVLKKGILEFNEEECLEDWLCRNSGPQVVNKDMFWVEWDPFLEVAIVQSSIFTFAKLRSKH